MSSTPINPLSALSPSSAQSAPNQKLGETAFLTLLSAELKYQNPLKPMSNTSFIAQLAQFSTLSAATKQEATLQQILSQVSAQNQNPILGASQLIGKTVTTSQGQGQVTSVTSGSQGIQAEVQGLGSVLLSDITGVL